MYECNAGNSRDFHGCKIHIDVCVFLLKLAYQREIALSTLLTIFGVAGDIIATPIILIRLPIFWLRFFVDFAAVRGLGYRPL